MVGRLAAGLLGGHVVRRAGHDAALGQAGVVGGAGQAEVGELDPLDAVLQQDVGRLDVAVDQALGVGGGQAGGGLHADPQDLLQASGPSRSIRSWSERPGTYCMTRKGSPARLVRRRGSRPCARGRPPPRPAPRGGTAAGPRRGGQRGESTLIATFRLKAGSYALNTMPMPPRRGPR